MARGLLGWFVSRLRRLAAGGWLLGFSRLVLFLAGMATAAVFGFARYLGVACWSRSLATIALSSTIAWSILAFINVYYGPHSLWEHRHMLGPGVFFANGLYWIAIGLCSFGISEVWKGENRWHMMCIIAAEALFWAYDIIIIDNLKRWRGTKKKPKKDEVSWASRRQEQLRTWICYVDRPAVFAFLVLWAGEEYLKWCQVFGDYVEEVFSAGAVFFALMTINLAFYAANRAEEDGISGKPASPHGAPISK